MKYKGNIIIIRKMKNISEVRNILKKNWDAQDYHVKVLTICVFITYSAISFYTPWYLVRFGFRIAFFNFLFLIPYSFTFYLIYLKKCPFAKIWFSMVYFLHILSVTVLFFSRETGYHYYHLSLIPISFILFSPDEAVYRRAVNYMNIAAFFFNIFIDVNIIPLTMSHQEQITSFYATLIFNIAGITWTLYIFSFELMNAEKRLKFLASYDQLTSLLNRRAFIELAGHEIRRFRRSGESFSVILIDLDFFKKINDTYGHSAGDLVLSEFSRLLKENLRESDIVSRFGGEEFICMMPDTGTEDAFNIMERIRSMELKVLCKGKTINYSFSAGVFSPETEGNEAGDLELDAVLEKADIALYNAKQSGRNCISVFSP